MEQQTETQTIQSQQKFPISPRNIVIFLIGIMIISSLIFYGLNFSNSGSNNTKEEEKNTPEKIVNLAPYTLVYGSWSQTGSNIVAYDLSTGKEYLLATLPEDIKKVSVLSPESIVYINHTDVRDHGREIVRYDLKTKKSEVLLRSSEGFGIDDYTLSPDKNSIALWEVQVNEESGVLLGGKSRIYTANIQKPDLKYLIYDEEASLENPVRYPRAILDDGKVLMDRFLPNNGAGWAYGMSVSNFTGTDKKDIETMQNGTYGTQPVLSSDGKYLAFAGYDGTKGAGTSNVNGIRRSLITMNTVELLDTATLTREKLQDLQNTTQYTSVRWGSTADELFITAASPEINGSGFIHYSITNQSVLTKSPTSIETYRPVTRLGQSDTLMAMYSDSRTSMTNLGPEYAVLVTSFAVAKSSSQQISDLTVIPTKSEGMQYLGLFPTEYLDSSLEQLPFDALSTDNIQLKSFVIKPKLPETRDKQQSKPVDERENPISDPQQPEQPDQPEVGNPQPNNPPPKSDNPPPKRACRDVYADQVLAACGAEPPKPPADATAEEQKVQFEKRSAWNQCLDGVLGPYYGGDTCAGSPLYLYGKPGTHVAVTIHTPIFNSSVPYSNGYSLTLGKSGTFSIKGETYDSIEYDYTPAIKKIHAPKYGTITQRVHIEKTLRDYAKSFKLNYKETEDLVTYGKSVSTGNYIFVSFFDHKTSHAILPITFDPKPEVYRNIVFYFKNLNKKPSYSVQPPTFDPIKRQGFTAIEVSGIVE